MSIEYGKPFSGNIKVEFKGGIKYAHYDIWYTFRESRHKRRAK